MSAVKKNSTQNTQNEMFQSKGIHFGFDLIPKLKKKIEEKSVTW